MAVELLSSPRYRSLTLLNALPPKNFTAASGVKFAKLLDQQPPFIKRGRLQGARAQGVRYERKAQAKLGEWVIGQAELDLVLSPWLEFVDDSGRRWCQPDALILNSSRSKGTVVEVKYRHTADAWFQIWRLYVPVLEILLPGFRWEGLEICKWYDPATLFPEAVALTRSPLEIPRPGITAVHIWNPARD